MSLRLRPCHSLIQMTYFTRATIQDMGKEIEIVLSKIWCYSDNHHFRIVLGCRLRAARESRRIDEILKLIFSACVTSADERQRRITLIIWWDGANNQHTIIRYRPARRRNEVLSAISASLATPKWYISIVDWRSLPAHFIFLIIIKKPG